MSTALTDMALCCHRNEIHARIANPCNIA